jgi:hypothetical protein
MMLTVGLLYIAFIILTYFPSVPSFIKSLVMKECWSYWRVFSVSIEIMCLSLFLFICSTHLVICICWGISVLLGWNWLGHDMYDLLICYRIQMRNSASNFIKRLAYNSFFLVPLSSFGIGVIVASWNAIDSIPSLSIS